VELGVLESADVYLITVLSCISIGFVGLLVQDGTIDLPFIHLPRFRFASDATCGAGSLFVSLCVAAHHAPGLTSLLVDAT
jgi:hypothetical protein